MPPVERHVDLNFCRDIHGFTSLTMWINQMQEEPAHGDGGLKPQSLRNERAWKCTRALWCQYRATVACGIPRSRDRTS